MTKRLAGLLRRQESPAIGLLRHYSSLIPRSPHPIPRSQRYSSLIPRPPRYSSLVPSLTHHPLQMELDEGCEDVEDPKDRAGEQPSPEDD